MGSTDCSELDLSNRVDFVLGQVVDTKDLEMVVPLTVKIFLASEVELWVVLEEGLDFGVQLTASACGRDVRHDGV